MADTNFLLAEDKALRQLLQGMTVTDQKADGTDTPRQVGVWFGQPDQELRQQAYPYVTIDMIDVIKDSERETRGLVAPDYLTPEGLVEGKGWEIHTPIPVIISYQITTYARHPRHDRELINQVVYSRLPFRFGTLTVETGRVDEDNVPVKTYRRLDVVNVSKRDVTESAKRLFVNAITVNVSSEIVQDTIAELYKVTQINMDTLDVTLQGGLGRNAQFTSVDPFTITE
jgi:hypothetical protein